MGEVGCCFVVVLERESRRMEEVMKTFCSVMFIVGGYAVEVCFVYFG